MQQVKAATVFALLLMTLCSCENSFIERQNQTTPADKVIANPPSDGPGGVVTNPGGQPYPTITKQTFIPEYSLWAQKKTLTWRIEWPNYPVGTDPNTIPTVFTLSNGALNSFDFLNGQPASTTYKTHFNLYHNAKLERSSDLWDELTHSFGHGDQMEFVSFSRFTTTIKGLENMVKNRPGLFETYWTGITEDSPEYQQGDIFLIKVSNVTDPTTPSRYGGIRIVSMMPRIIEVYLAVPND
ncbi:hypothetical protein BN8_02866 [Fibrisoma limi BUZ 3]|uniref:Lipoprotein n=1 Tax=Fibrisoma limi BUZ 3 TaxID=1185876 RepID=I2GIM0_9BACT|nr:hypothetical protein [Fibrisoma limi]CCH53745.1 hypothetical protein BN8_02866 [Fibrisoma limi BUZ 3]